jgi:hypothetical protein
MWIASKYGFYSLKHDEATGKYFIRARVRLDLMNLIAKVPELSATTVQEWPRADYRYRIITDARGVQGLMKTLGESVDYGNFKDMIARTPGQDGKLSPYHRIWALMAALQR